jgi:hypothetical protein
LSMKRKQKISAWYGDFEGMLHEDSKFGTTMGAPGDIDGDLVPDLLVGSAEGVWTIRLSREGRVRSTALTVLPKDSLTRAASIGRSIAVRHNRAPSELVGLAVGGTIGIVPDTRDGAMWLPHLDSNGAMH